LEERLKPFFIVFPALVLGPATPRAQERVGKIRLKKRTCGLCQKIAKRKNEQNEKQTQQENKHTKKTKKQERAKRENERKTGKPEVSPTTKQESRNKTRETTK
jgi:hypothetical protein